MAELDGRFVRNSQKAAQELDALKKEWDYGMSTWLADADFVGENTGLTKADVTAVVGTTLAALDSLLAAGHGTNLLKVKL